MARVMVVDENRELADGVVRELESHGHDAVAAYTGAEAMTRAAEFDFDTAIVDIRLPHMSGLTLVARLMEAHAASNYLLMTNFSGADTFSEAVAIRQGAVLDKPLDVGRLLRLVAGSAASRGRQPAADRSVHPPAPDPGLGRHAAA